MQHLELCHSIYFCVCHSTTTHQCQGGLVSLVLAWSGSRIAFHIIIDSLRSGEGLGNGSTKIVGVLKFKFWKGRRFLGKFSHVHSVRKVSWEGQIRRTRGSSRHQKIATAKPTATRYEQHRRLHHQNHHYHHDGAPTRRNQPGRNTNPP